MIVYGIERRELTHVLFVVVQIPIGHEDLDEQLLEFGAESLAGQAVENEIRGVVDVEQEENEPGRVAIFEQRQVEVETTQQLEGRVGKRENHERDRDGHEHHGHLFLARLIQRVAVGRVHAVRVERDRLMVRGVALSRGRGGHGCVGCGRGCC